MLQRPIVDAVQRITSNPGIRFGFLTAVALTGIWAIQNWSPDGASADASATTQVLEARQMMTGLLGFMMWKLAVVGVTTVPMQRHQHASLQTDDSQ